MTQEVEETKIIVSVKRFKELQEAERKLACLEAGGVDNWEWYSESLRAGGFFSEEDEDDDDDDD